MNSRKRFLLKSIMFSLCISTSSMAGFSQSALERGAYGVWNRGGFEFNPDNPNYNYLKGISAENSSWNKLQPDDSATYNWGVLQESIDYAVDKDMFLYLGINFGPDAPDWIYNHGVPKVFTTEQGHAKHEKWPYYPYYPDEDYKRYYRNFLIELGEFLKSQPKHKQERVVFMQVKTGCTGDEAAYKGTPDNPDYALPKKGKKWSDFRLYAFSVYNEVFNNEDLKIPLLFNSIEPESFPSEWNWVLSEIGNGFGIKQGALVRGHHLNGERHVVENWKPFLINPKDLALFSRSEMDQTWKRPLYQNNVELAFYWGMLNGLNRGLSVWDMSGSSLRFAGTNPGVQNSLHFFNKYADQVYPESSNKAFIAFHEGLDASDTIKFPESKYGKANHTNEERYEAICKDPVYAHRGAKMEDLYAATRGQVYQRSRQTGYNDAGWEIWPGNYSRFITQINPEQTSIGLFRINGPIDSDSPVYSRFARSFEHSTGKNAMYFKLQDGLIENKPDKVTFTIRYFDKVEGSEWEFQYDSGEKSLKTAKTISCTGDQTWKTLKIELSDAVLNHNGPQGSDFALINTDNKDDVFHMIEFEIVVPEKK